MLTTRMPWDSEDVMREKNALKAEQMARLRDEFAMAALTGICAHTDTWGYDSQDIVIKAYQLSELMLKAREVQS